MLRAQEPRTNGPAVACRVCTAGGWLDIALEDHMDQENRDAGEPEEPAHQRDRGDFPILEIANLLLRLEHCSGTIRCQPSELLDTWTGPIRGGPSGGISS